MFVVAVVRKYSLCANIHNAEMKATEIKFRVACALIMGVAATLRFWAIDLKPAHFDEGINGWFADRIRETGYYKYDPTNYHGPLYFYAVFVSQELLGRSLFALRLPALLAGLASIALILRLAPPFFGRSASLLAALAIALSPAFVFYTRYSIHESTLVLFNIVFFFGVLELWKNGTRAGLFLTAVGLTGMVLTKETYIIQTGSLVIAFGCLALWNRIVPVHDPFPAAARQWSMRDAFAAASVSIVTLILFYSGFLMDWDAVQGLWKTFSAWFSTGIESGGHAKPNFDIIGPLNAYWLWLAWRYEAFLLACIFAAIMCIFPQRPITRLTAIYGCGLLLAYSIIPYKTPWCIIAWAWPFFLVGPAVALSLQNHRARQLAVLGLLLLTGLDFFRSLRLNFREFANPAEPYVYVQTFPEIDRLTKPLLSLAQKNPQNLLLRGEILIPSYFPLPWILGDFSNIAYYGGENWPEQLTGDFIVVEEKRKAEAFARMQPGYFEVSFRLRDSMEPCVVFFRASLFQGALSDLRSE